jgi:hypothetical protein
LFVVETFIEKKLWSWSWGSWSLAPRCNQSVRLSLSPENVQKLHKLK